MPAWRHVMPMPCKSASDIAKQLDSRFSLDSSICTNVDRSCTSDVWHGVPTCGAATVMHRLHLCRQLATRLHRCQCVTKTTISSLPSPAQQASAQAWAIRSRDSAWLRRRCRIAPPPFCRAMTAAELQDVPNLDRSQFTSTLHLKALRLDASQCQQYMKALQGCGLPTCAFTDMSTRLCSNQRDTTRPAGTYCIGHASRLSCAMRLMPQSGCCCSMRRSAALVRMSLPSG